MHRTESFKVLDKFDEILCKYRGADKSLARPD